MSWDAIGAIGEVVGAAATVATLLYLAVQIRANTRATLADSRRTNYNARVSTLSDVIGSEDVASVFERGLANPASLSSTERMRFDFLLSRFVADAAMIQLELRDGFDEQDVLNMTLVHVLNFLRTPGGRDFWVRHGATVHPEARARIEAELERVSSEAPGDPQ